MDQSTAARPWFVIDRSKKPSHIRCGLASLLIVSTLGACRSSDSNNSAAVQDTRVASTCTGTWPSYWQDPAFSSATMWQGQYLSNTPESQNWSPSNPAYTNPPFWLADAYSVGQPDDPASQTWRDKRFDAIFTSRTPPAERTRLVNDYGWNVMRYMQEGNIQSGNINTDWNLCANTRRRWFHMPFQTYNVLQGREFIHGLTREASVIFSVSTQEAALPTTVWAVAFFNGNAAPTLASVWASNAVAHIPTTNLNFAEGTVIGKLLFTTATAAELPILKNLPTWTANTSIGQPGATNPTFCRPDGNATMPQQSEVCKRSPRTVTLLQFDFAIRDSRAPNGWVFGTFAADGEAKAAEPIAWNRISLMGLMWGDDTPPASHLASTFPEDPKKNGFTDGVIAWDVVERLNKAGGSDLIRQPGHLGCNFRLNGPADNVSSSCTSCHMTASVPDKNNVVPPLLAQFSGASNPLTPQCAAPSASTGVQRNGVTFAQIDSIYFAQTRCASPFACTLNGVSIYGPNMPEYASGSRSWISTDFSLQMSQALQQWNEWQAHLASEKAWLASLSQGKKTLTTAKVPSTAPPRVYRSALPVRQGQE